jgi:hypothetical protein
VLDVRRWMGADTHRSDVEIGMYQPDVGTSRVE